MIADHEAMDTNFEKPGAQSQFRQRLDAQIDSKWADLILLGCFFCSGLVDSMAFNMYACFVSMQTGNTIFVGLGVNGQPDSAPRYSWAKSLTAIVCFALGALFFSTFHRFFGPQKRWVLISSFAIQALLVAVVAIITTIPVIPNHPPVVITRNDSEFLTFTMPSTFPGSDFAAITILAFQSAGQIVASRALKYNAMPTVVLTSLYCDLMSDAQLFTAPLGQNADRNRRFLGAVLLLAGAISGAFLTKSDAGFKGGLWIAVFIKTTMAVAWFFWKQKKVVVKE
ncbi:uncharacterized protein EKO05_0002918 [Ascochyta rabiei]|uniref:Uncharacterized protein n=1 Tax=Didymella rabiei TaxID=5454 RepID=A0A162X3D4_DIDRA|nr:uncharacterized protein EKO05_0002918 [Ascochyta rabiei]KZM19333.1 hypothetical protein ST47_g9537 [Ascochyta rabiei]UPX12368.1 hypothetical protein EKO05_0002918 [Ascochyta rabiei]